MENQLSKRAENDKLKKEIEASFFNYCLKMAETSHVPATRTSLTRDFIQSNGINRSCFYFYHDFNDIINTVRTGAHSLEVQAKLFFVTSTPISDAFLEELLEVATVKQDEEKRIISFKSKINNLSFEGTPRKKVPRKIKKGFQKETKIVTNKEDPADKMNENDNPELEEAEPEPTIEENFENPILEANGANLSVQTMDQEQRIPDQVEHHEHVPGPSTENFGQAPPDHVPLEETQRDQDPFVSAQEMETPLNQALLDEAQPAHVSFAQARRSSQTNRLPAPRASIQDHYDNVDEELISNVHEEFFKGFLKCVISNLPFDGLDDTSSKLIDMNYEEKKILDPSLVKSHFEVYIGGLVCQKVAYGDGYNLKKLFRILLLFVEDKKTSPFLQAKLLPYIHKQLRQVEEEDTVSEELISNAIKGIVDGLELQSREVNRRPKERIQVHVANNNNNTSPHWPTHDVPRQLHLVPLESVVKKEPHSRDLEEKRKRNQMDKAMEPALKRVKREPKNTLSSWMPASRNLTTGENAGTSTRRDPEQVAVPGPSALVQGPIVRTSFIKAEPNDPEPIASAVVCVTRRNKATHKS